MNLINGVPRELLDEILADLESGMMCNPSQETLRKLRTILAAPAGLVEVGEVVVEKTPLCTLHKGVLWASAILNELVEDGATLYVVKD